MFFKVTPEWMDRQLKQGDDSFIGAGGMTKEEFARDAAARRVTSSAIDSENKLGKAVQFVRENKGWTRERLAENADVDINEIVSIETELGFIPRTRTAFCLAETLGFSQRRMKELIGLLQEKVGVAEQDAVYIAFATHSKNVSKATKDDFDTVRALVDVLADKSDDE